MDREKQDDPRVRDIVRRIILGVEVEVSDAGERFLLEPLVQLSARELDEYGSKIVTNGVILLRDVDAQRRSRAPITDEELRTYWGLPWPWNKGQKGHDDSGLRRS